MWWRTTVYVFCQFLFSKCKFCIDSSWNFSKKPIVTLNYLTSVTNFPLSGINIFFDSTAWLALLLSLVCMASPPHSPLSCSICHIFSYSFDSFRTSSVYCKCSLCITLEARLSELEKWFGTSVITYAHQGSWVTVWKKHTSKQKSPIFHQQALNALNTFFALIDRAPCEHLWV